MQTAANDSRNELVCNETPEHPQVIVTVHRGSDRGWQWFMKVALRGWTIHSTVYNKNIFRCLGLFLTKLCRDAVALLE